MSSLVTAVVVTGATAYAGYEQGKKSSKAQAAANEAQRKINRLKNKQAKRQYLRQFRQAQADVYTAAVAANVGLESSAFQAIRSSHMAQRDTALREFKAFDALGGEQSAAMTRASNAAFRAQTYGTIAGFASGFIQPGGFAGIFKD